MAHAEKASLLRERIDDLSTRLLMGESAEGDGRLLADLAELGKQAREAGFEAAARATAELLVRAGDAGEPGAAEQCIRQGLALLEQALEQSPHTAPAPDPEPARLGDCLAQDPELVADFLVEAREHLGSIEQQLLTLERDPGNGEAIHSVFRGFHTIKGLAGFLEFSSIQEVAHEVETALNQAREGRLRITPAVIDVILESVDHLSRSLAGIESGEAGCSHRPGHE